MIPLSLADLRLAARLLSEAAAALSRTATTPREADKARRMKKLSNKLLKKIDNEQQRLHPRLVHPHGKQVNQTITN